MLRQHDGKRKEVPNVGTQARGGCSGSRSMQSHRGMGDRHVAKATETTLREQTVYAQRVLGTISCKIPRALPSKVRWLCARLHIALLLHLVQ